MPSVLTNKAPTRPRGSRVPRSFGAGTPASGARARLALWGGPRTVRSPYREGWRQVHWRDLLRIAQWVRRDVSTLTGGGPLAEFERRFAQLTGAEHALLMNSGTAALLSAYYAVGVRPGDEVIVPTYTFFASAAPILQCGGTPVFCDVDERTLTADPDDVERRITPRTRAICVVHLWGNPARLDRFVELAARHRVALIEDASHAHGALYQGRPVGSWGDVGCFSLQGQKAVSGGEAGVAVTSDPRLFDHMLALGHFGRVHTEQRAATYNIEALSLGLKHRPHLYAACLLAGSLARLPELNRRRAHNLALLTEALAGCDAVQPVQSYPEAVRGGFLEFILRVRGDRLGGVSRAAFVSAVRAEGVPLEVDRYTVQGARSLLHRQPLFNELDYAALAGGVGGGENRNRGQAEATSVPVAERLAGELVTLPAFTKTPANYVRACGRALRKVALGLSAVRDFRTGAGESHEECIDAE
jgi:perosamine synthetase